MGRQKKGKKRICYNCVFAGQKFKIGGMTHLHCFHKKTEGQIAWETLREFYSNCGDYAEAKPQETVVVT